MNLTLLATTPPRAAGKVQLLTPELLASVLARYSRSNDGLEVILSKVDLEHPEESTNRILRMTDYGHASIGGLTGGIAVAIDGVSMFLAFLLFAVSPHADGQESSTRYIKLDASSLPDWGALGFPDDLGAMLDALAKDGLRRYQEEYDRLDALAKEHPERIRYPEGASAKMQERIRVNYALDRARYFLPFALKTNVALVQTGRAWADTISALLSHPSVEAQGLGQRLKTEVLDVMAPNLGRHAKAKPGWAADFASDHDEANLLTLRSLKQPPLDEGPAVQVQSFGRLNLVSDLDSRENRYDRCGRSTRAAQIQVRWPAMAVAEIRDLNRHRTGHRWTPLAHVGFYLPPEIDASAHVAFTREVHAMQLRLDLFPHLRPYALFLGSQSPFEQSVQLDKFVYQAELRTGPGAHAKYAQDHRDAVAALKDILGARQVEAIELGQAEPE